MLVESAGRPDSVSLTPWLEVDIGCVGTLRLTIEKPFVLESAVRTSIASIVAPPLVTATHSGDPKDVGVASGTVTVQHRDGSVRAALAHARSPDPSRFESMPALIFDLDGTLVDTVYAHVFAWHAPWPRRGC
jgi:hypothetical protein